MTLLHDLFTSRNLQAFQRSLSVDHTTGNGNLQSTSAPTSGGKSWNRASSLTSMKTMYDVNKVDWLGRTPLHLACASVECIEYVRALLKHPGVNVNLADRESHWTPLHRALYHANLPAALLLLQRTDIDPSLKDLEGYTAFDLYNSTLNGTKPSASDDKRAELFTWGTNRNAVLGLGDGDDRIYPDQIVIQPQVDPAELQKMGLETRFSPIHVHQVQMSKLHTAVVTSENGGNVCVCGFGSGGRLGPGQHTQYSLKSLPHFTHTIVSVALGQDHTLALTKLGEVLSWGLNRFSQLGYVVESSARHEEQIQATPKKIYGPLRKEVVRGVCASKCASACWTEGEVFTWGTNHGQLGYDRAAHPVQVLPKKIIKVNQPVIAIALTDSAMACLLRNQQVECIWNDRHYRINFPTQAFPSEIQPYRPPQAVKDAHISKITSCDDVFAALSSNGEVFTFSVPILGLGNTGGMESLSLSGSVPSSESRVGGAPFRPQRVWALRKKFSAVNDVALGSEGSIIICTEAGHVFVRTRSSASSTSSSGSGNKNSNPNSNSNSSTGKTFKFQRVPYLQRVTQVCANSTGAYGALRVDYRPREVEVGLRGVEEDLCAVRPFVDLALEEEGEGCLKKMKGIAGKVDDEASTLTLKALDDGADDADDGPIRRDVGTLLDLLEVLGRGKERGKRGEDVQVDTRFPHGADTILSTTKEGAVFPVHRVVLAARSPVLRRVLAGKGVQSQSGITLRLLSTTPTSKPKSNITQLSISGCHPFSILILLQYLYTDDLPAIWDRRVYTVIEKKLVAAGISHAQVKVELKALAGLLELPLLAYALEWPSKRVPGPSLRRDLGRLFDEVNLNFGPFERVDEANVDEAQDPLAPDVVLELADRDVRCHSLLLRARSELFESFFEEGEWTEKRWCDGGVVRIDLRHLGWGVMEFVLRYMVCGEEEGLFEKLEFASTVDDVLDFMFDVMGAANELLLDGLILLCSAVILKYLNIHNACYILSDATHYHATQLVESVQGYMTANMESLLESRMLDDMPYALVKQLAKFARQQQLEKSPFSRSGVFVEKAMEKHAEWLKLQDVPEPIIGSHHHHKAGSRKEATVGRVKQSPPDSGSSKKSVELVERPNPTTPQKTLRRPPSGDDVFIMDEPDSPRAESIPLTPQAPPPTSPPVWKAATVPRVDMKTVMVEAASMSRTPSSHGPSNQKPPPLSSGSGNWKVPSSEPRKPSSSPFDGPSGFPLLGEPSPSEGWRNSADQRSMPSVVLPSPSRVGGSEKSGPQAQVSLPLPLSLGRTTQHAVQGLGPMITPTRQSPASKSKPSTFPGTRSVSGNGNTKAWTLPPVQPVIATPTTTSNISFVAIQHSQAEAEHGGPVKDKRSLREIQEEERSLREEADFLMWWGKEEERVKREVEALEGFRSERERGGGRKAQRRRGGGGGGRGRQGGAGAGGGDDGQAQCSRRASGQQPKIYS